MLNFTSANMYNNRGGMMGELSHLHFEFLFDMFEDQHTGKYMYPHFQNTVDSFIFMETKNVCIFFTRLFGRQLNMWVSS